MKAESCLAADVILALLASQDLSTVKRASHLD
jgi:hypothetical protein